MRKRNSNNVSDVNAEIVTVHSYSLQVEHNNVNVNEMFLAHQNVTRAQLSLAGRKSLRWKLKTQQQKKYIAPRLTK